MTIGPRRLSPRASLACRTAFRLPTLLLAVLGAGGCAAWSTAARPGPDGRLAIALAPIEAAATVRHLRELSSDPAPATDEAQAIARELAVAGSAIGDRLGERLAEGRRWRPSPGGAGTTWAAAASPELPPFAATAPPLLRLEVRIVGYGRIEKKWLYLLIGSGVVEAAVQGAVAAQLAGPWAGAAVAAEEIVQEALVWGGGERLFSRFYAPVTLTARLLDAPSGRVLWRTWVFSRATRKLRRSLPEPDRQRREVLLAATAADAARELAHRLERAARRHLPRS